MPATNPFHATIVSGSLPEMLRVKLLSTPQSTQARMIPKAPSERPNPLLKLVERKMLANVMTIIATHARRPMASLKNNRAIKVVATPSKFNNNEAVDAGVLFKLTINTIGATIPPEMIAPASHLISGDLIPASASLERIRWVNLTRRVPVPLPRYKNDARKIGATSPNNNLAMGALAPKNTAASRACKINGKVDDFIGKRFVY